MNLNFIKNMFNGKKIKDLEETIDVLKTDMGILYNRTKELYDKNRELEEYLFNISKTLRALEEHLKIVRKTEYVDDINFPAEPQRQIQIYKYSKIKPKKEDNK